MSTVRMSMMALRWSVSVVTIALSLCQLSCGAGPDPAGPPDATDDALHSDPSQPTDEPEVDIGVQDGDVDEQAAPDAGPGSCESPIIIDEGGGHYVGTNVGATDDFLSCRRPLLHGDSIYRYTPPADGTLIVSTNHGGTLIDTVIGVYSMCLNAEDFELACADDVSDTNYRSSLRVAVEGGFPVWIAIDGAPAGEFELSVELLPLIGEGGGCSLDPTTPLCMPDLGCIDGTCAPYCPHADDGVCDEPEGTGLCPDGTDRVDCTLCPSHSHPVDVNVCECDAGYVPNDDGTACVLHTCTLGGDECGPGLDCGYDSDLRLLRCRPSGSAGIGSVCLPYHDDTTVDARYICDHELVCDWPSCSGAQACARLCETASDCDGDFFCGRGLCDHFPGTGIGFCL